MISKLTIKGFRCLKELPLDFKPGVNLLVWENDAWKTSILTVLRLLKWEYFIDDEDFREWEDKISIDVTVNWEIFLYERTKSSNIEKVIQYVDLDKIRTGLSLDTLDELVLGKLIKAFWGNLTGLNSKASKKSKLNSIISWFWTITLKELEVSKSIMQWYFQNIQYEDGKNISNIQDNFRNYIKHEVNSIWSQEINVVWTTWSQESKKISEIIWESLESIKARKESDYSASLLPSIQEVIPNITKMELSLTPNLWNFSAYESKIDFFQTWRTTGINIDKKWDWTKRRVTIALFKHESLRVTWVQNIYLFDEPDTHLNLRVQKDLVSIFDTLASSGHQIIFTSHSPFILNLVSITDVILLSNNWDETKKIDMDISDQDEFIQILNSLGIQNIDIFFSKCFIFYEGASEFNFFESIYYKKNTSLIEKKFIRQINCEGIDKVAIFVDNFIKIIGENVRIIAVVDKDYELLPKTKSIIDKLSARFTSITLIKLWTKEFEDEFTDSQIYNCFRLELNAKGINNETELNTFRIGSSKFSEALSRKIDIWKPKIWTQLANYLDYSDLSSNLKSVIDTIESM